MKISQIGMSLIDKKLENAEVRNVSLEPLNVYLQGPGTPITYTQLPFKKLWLREEPAKTNAQ